MTSPDAPLGAPRRNRPGLQRMGALALKVLGWRLRGELPPVPKFVAIVAPHTSNLDFFVGVAVMFALDADVHFFAKDTLFLGPFGAALRALGGRPVRRQAPEGVVAEVAAAVRESPQFILALAPEGTRSRVADWRTGFYRIAEAAEIPILAVWLDWDTPIRPTSSLSLILLWNMVGPTALGYWVWANVLTRTSASSASQVLLLSPVYGMVQSHFVLGEHLGPAILAAAACVISGAMLTFWQPRMSGTDRP